MRRLREYLTLESDNAGDLLIDSLDVPEVVPVTDEEVYEAEDELHQAEEVVHQHKVDLADDQAALTELTERQASLEQLQDLVAFGLEREQYSPQFAAVIQHALDGYASMVGDQVGLPSLEDYSHTNLKDFYVSSNEAFSDLIDKLKKAINSTQTKIKRGLASMGTNTGVAKALDTKADAALAELGNIDTDASVEVSLTGVRDMLNLAGSVPSDLSAAITRDLKSRAYLDTTYTDALAGQVRKMADLVVKATTAGKSAGPGLVNQLMNVAHPYDRIPAGIRDGKELFGYRFVFERPASRDIKAYVEQGCIPMLEDVDATDNTKHLSLAKADVAKLLNGIKQYAALLRQLADKNRDMDKELSKLVEHIQIADRDKMHPDADRMAMYLNNTAFGVYHTHAEVMVSIRHVGNALLQLAERAIKDLKKAK